MVELFESRTIFLTIGNIHITWYGVMYVVAFWSAWALLPKLGKMRGVILSKDAWTSIVAWGALGVVLGGRLGYALLYEPSFFLAHPLELFQIWHGGMSSHGGFIGAALAVWLVARRMQIYPLTIADIVSPLAAGGLMLGRIGNGINQEFGTYAIYEAIGDGCIALICFYMLGRSKRQGFVFSVFLLLYGVERFFLEYIRPQEWPIFLGLSRGQLFTIPLLIIAVLLLVHAFRRDIQKTI